MISKNAGFHADFESVKKVAEKYTQKVISKTSLTNTSKVKIVHISVMFLLITFLVHFFKTFSTDSKSG